ncbi:MAG: lipocalin family protein [Prolixibacteraceae bacterium]
MLSKTISFLVILILTGNCNKSSTKVDNSAVNELDLQRYLGTWYEIARFDHPFERNLVGVTATYELRDDGKIRVINKGYKNTLDGKLKTAKGKAKRPNPEEEPGRFKVAFFLFFYADYIVMELDENYEWALIGSSGDEYLWILSRTPQPSKDVVDKIAGLAKNRGYDTGKLIWVKQPKAE